ncbi:MAG: adenosylcobinamide-GDP ribazoletransferase [Clostridiales bacterium]|nr:adenosylcobinamide-GDP ribazoletransferase [Candidatus Blautia equi]
MKVLWNNFKIAFSMFSKIHMPMADWNKENMKYMLCFFPFVGTVIGLLTLGAEYLAIKLGYGTSFTAMVLVLLPVLVTGGIHVDGLLDTSDAMSSWQERERRLEILKDSHTGAFAIINACIYFLAWFGAASEIAFNTKAIAILAMGYMVSRSLSGIGVVCFPKATEKGTVHEFSSKAENKTVRNVLIVYLILLCAAMILIQPLYGAAAFAGALLVFFWYYRMAMKYFGGTTGDLSGCFLCVCEVGIALILALVSRIPMIG